MKLFFSNRSVSIEFNNESSSLSYRCFEQGIKFRAGPRQVGSISRGQQWRAQLEHDNSVYGPTFLGAACRSRDAVLISAKISGG